MSYHKTNNTTMTVHMVRLFTEEPQGNAEQAINNWVQNHNEWEETRENGTVPNGVPALV